MLIADYCSGSSCTYRMKLPQSRRLLLGLALVRRLGIML